jgi:hypothetical protein
MQKRRIEMEFVMDKKKKTRPETQASPAKEVPRDITLCWDERRKMLLACFANERAEALGRRRIIGYDLGTVGSLEEVFTAIAERFPAQGTPSNDDLESLRSKGSHVPFPVTLFWVIR